MRATFAIALSLAPGVFASVGLPALFTDGCVLQTTDEGGPSPQLYGWASAGELVRVSLSWHSGAIETYSSKADKDGAWAVTFPSLPVSKGAFDLNITGTVAPVAPPRLAKGCVAGDVIVCSGQCASMRREGNFCRKYTQFPGNLRSKYVL